jgi:large subunit ribosomal protein L17
MRHRKHSNQLGVKKEHREALLANLSTALITHGKIKTTLKKAKALRPFVEKVITLAKKGSLHNRRIAIARVRDTGVVHELFEEKVEQFRDRNGGYTRIYKLGTRRGDAAEMALIELIDADDEGYGKKTKPKSRAKKKAKAAVEETAVSEEAAVAEETVDATEEDPVAEEESVVAEEVLAAEVTDEVEEETKADGSEDVEAAEEGEEEKKG